MNAGDPVQIALIPRSSKCSITTLSCKRVEIYGKFYIKFPVAVKFLILPA